MSDEKDIAKIVTMLSAAYPNWKTTAFTVEVYYQDLRDLPADLLAAACAKARTNTERNLAFAPSTGEIRAAATEILRTIAGVPSSYQAWQEVLRVIVEVGSYRTPEFSHPLIADAVRTLGWRNLCLSEDQTSDRFRFIQAYEQLASRAESDAMELPQVRGYIEAHGGKMLPSPVSQMGTLALKLSIGRPQ